jgi:4-alpha-glucanotransferase
MSASELAQLAEAAGLVLDWEDAQGVARRVTPEAIRPILTALDYPCDSQAERRESLQRLAARPEPSIRVIDAGAAFAIPGASGRARLRLESGEASDIAVGEAGRVPAISEPGYHSLELSDRSLTVAVCPKRCVTPEARLGRRAWGLTVQIYSLAGAGPFGDLGDLARFAAEAGAAGADVLAISPVHALFADDPGRYSPYSPSSRDRLNGVLADAGALGAPRTVHPSAPLIDWRAAIPEKLAELRRLLDQARGDRRFQDFVAEGGDDLRHHALFEALHAHFRRTQTLDDWRRWPTEFRRPDLAEAAAAGLNLQPEIDFHLMVQWLADLGLEQAQATARAAGMGLGLITDLAVGLDPAGAHAWARGDELLAGLTLGAPPDAFQADGQGWGITTFAPDALRRNGYAPFLRTVRAALRHAGGVRIDHALGLKRLWVIPDGASPLDGAYLSQPLDELLGLIALESHRADAVVIGEDLGVVPPGLRDALDARGLLGMRVLPFERSEDGGFRAPETYDSCAAAMTSTHDLPPVAGWWAAGDLDWRGRLDETYEPTADEQERAAGRHALWTAAVSAGAAQGAEPATTDPQPAVDAAIALVAQTACELALVPVEDFIGLEAQVNLPGVVERHPNWRRRLPLSASELFADAAVRRRIERLNAERPR